MKENVQFVWRVWNKMISQMNCLANINSTRNVSFPGYKKLVLVPVADLNCRPTIETLKKWEGKRKEPNKGKRTLKTYIIPCFVKPFDNCYYCLFTYYLGQNRFHNDLYTSFRKYSSHFLIHCADWKAFLVLFFWFFFWFKGFVNFSPLFFSMP